MIELGFSVEPKGATPAQFKQVHGNTIVEIDGEAVAAPADADGASTKNPEIELHVFTADCIPLLFHTPHEIAAVHCGWRGAMLGIARAAVEKLGSEKLHVSVGPSILKCCFEVKEDFLATFPAAKPYTETREGKLYCDLFRYVRETDLAAIADANIHTENLRCTYCSDPAPALLPEKRRNRSEDQELDPAPARDMMNASRFCS